jgi:hypothetical protein
MMWVELFTTAEFHDGLMESVQIQDGKRIHSRHRGTLLRGFVTKPYDQAQRCQRNPLEEAIIRPGLVCPINY